MKPLFPGRRFSFLRLFIAILCIALVAAGTWSWITFTRTAAKKLPEPWFGGYADVTATPSYEFESKVGNVYRNVILGFVTAGDGCQPSWGGYYTLDEAASTLDLDSRIAQTYKTDRTVTVSFGGQNGTELASACSDVDSLADAYQQVIDRYHITSLDFDIENKNLDGYSETATRRAQAVAKLIANEKAKNKGKDDTSHDLIISLTLPADAKGLTMQGMQTVNAFLDAGVTLAAQNGSGDYFNASDVLRHAIEDNTISVLYQPIFDVNTKRITSLDTIVRVHDAKGRTLAPYFVTAEAHRLNMSVQLTLDVLETCVKDMTAFRKVAPELDIVDICMNGSELGASIFHERLEQLTHEQPQLRFGLQLGSHAIHVVHDEVDDEVAALAALPNVELGLTNAGTTYSEVAAFAHLPLDFARFDKTVVRDFRTPRAKQIMQRTLEISRDNDAFHVVFDGVESLDQVEFIRSIGGTLAEGTLLSNAMSANEFLMRLETMGTSLPEAAPRQAE